MTAFGTQSRIIAGSQDAAARRETLVLDCGHTITRAWRKAMMPTRAYCPACLDKEGAGHG